jgi:dTDP-4-amino-4,6-dideoxygalactose transaminase
MTNTKISWPTWPHIAVDEIAAVSAVLESGKINYWTGQVGRQFETEFAQFIGVQHAIALANGTLALELALKAIDLQPGDEVIVPSKTFIATASAVVACQGIPIVADVDLQTQNISAASIEPLITAKTKAIIVVHLGGLTCDMDSIMLLAKQHNIKVIEDCAQALGARYKNKLAGSLGHVGVFSFCQDKIITSGGEGGMLATNDESIWRRAWEYKDHGKDYAAVHDTKSVSPGFRWLHNSFGSNYRLSEMQSAIGLAQLRKLPTWLEKRKRNADYLIQGLKNIIGLTVYQPSSYYQNAYYKFYVHVQPGNLNSAWSRDKIIAAITELGVPCREGGCSEIYREQAFVKRGLGPKTRLPTAQILSATTIQMEVHHMLELEHMAEMLHVVQHVMQQATK